MSLIVVNLAGAGSTDVRKKFLGKGFNGRYMMTIGADFALKEVSIGDSSIKFHIWDLQGSPRPGPIPSVYHYGRLGFLIFFKKNDRRSFEDVPLWFEDFKKHNGRPIHLFSKDQLVLIGLIQELEDVTTEEGERLAERLGMSYYEMTLESGKTINEIFRKLGEWYFHYVGMS